MFFRRRQEIKLQDRFGVGHRTFYPHETHTCGRPGTLSH